MRALAAFICIIGLFGCDVPTEEEEPDVLAFQIFSIEGVDTLNPLVIWEGTDGSRFEVTEGWIVCEGTSEPGGILAPPTQEFFTWRFGEPGAPEISGEWVVDLDYCVIRNGILEMTYGSPNATFSARTERRTGQYVDCWRFTKRLPSAPFWTSGWPRDSSNPPLPERIVFPDPMPEVRYWSRLGCESGSVP